MTSSIRMDGFMEDLSNFMIFFLYNYEWIQMFIEMSEPNGIDCHPTRRV